MPSPGQRLAGRYELIEPIGSGGMAVVWRARDLRLDRPVAVKLLRQELAEDADVAVRFASEAQRAASLAHPNVAAVYDTDVDGDERFIVMELVDGGSVAELLGKRGRLDPETAVDIAASAARALTAAHRRGLIHRDVKPANLLLGRDGRTRLADFGIARALTASRTTAPGTVLGSIPYLSPEQARGDEASAAGDVFSLGVVLFEMLTGSLPWEADTPAALATVRLHAPAPPPSNVIRGLPDGLDAIVARALATDPGERYASARVFADALEGWTRRHHREARTAAAREARRTRRTTGRRQLAAAAAGAAAAGGATATAVGVASPNPDARRPSKRSATRRAAPRSQTAGAVVSKREAANPPPSLVRAAAAAAVEEDGRRRRGELVLAGIAVSLVGAVALAMLLGGDRGAPGAVAVASPSDALPSQLAAPTLQPGTAATPTTLPTAAPATQGPAATRPAPAKPPPTEPPTAHLSAPARAVAAFYDAVVDHDWDRAIDLWSPSMQQRYPPREYLIGRFKPTTRIDITRLVTVFVDGDAGMARVSVSLVEYRSSGPSPRTFVGSWDLVRINGEWKLDDPNF